MNLKPLKGTLGWFSFIDKEMHVGLGIFLRKVGFRLHTFNHFLVTFTT